MVLWNLPRNYERNYWCAYADGGLVTEHKFRTALVKKKRMKVVSRFLQIIQSIRYISCFYWNELTIGGTYTKTVKQVSKWDRLMGLNSRLYWYRNEPLMIYLMTIIRAHIIQAYIYIEHNRVKNMRVKELTGNVSLISRCCIVVLIQKCVPYLNIIIRVVIIQKLYL